MSQKKFACQISAHRYGMANCIMAHPLNQILGWATTMGTGSHTKDRFSGHQLCDDIRLYFCNIITEALEIQSNMWYKNSYCKEMSFGVSYDLFTHHVSVIVCRVNTVDIIMLTCAVIIVNVARER